MFIRCAKKFKMGCHFVDFGQPSAIFGNSHPSSSSMMLPTHHAHTKDTQTPPKQQQGFDCVSAPLFNLKFVAVKVQMIANISRR